MNPSEVWLVWPKMFFAPDSELDVTSTMIDLQTIRDNLITLFLIVLIPLTQLISLVRVSCSEVLHTKQYWEGVSWPITIWVTCSYLTNNNYHTHTSPDTTHVHSSPTRSKLQAKNNNLLLTCWHAATLPWYTDISLLLPPFAPLSSSPWFRFT